MKDRTHQSQEQPRQADYEAASSTPESYSIGYRKPPLATQFKKGQSGNPRGRPKGAKSDIQSVSFTDALQRELSRAVLLANGKKLSSMDVLAKSQVAQAIKGKQGPANLIAKTLSSDSGRGTKASEEEMRRRIGEALTEADEARHREAAAGAETFTRKVRDLRDKMEHLGLKIVQTDANGTTERSPANMSLVEIVAMVFGDTSESEGTAIENH